MVGAGLRLASVEEAAKLLREGKVGVVPTETVVGLVAGERGIDRLTEIKGRNPDKPIALLCASKRDAFGLAREVPVLAHSLANRFWPGALTLVLDASDGGTVGVRVPDHPVVRTLLLSYGAPFYATSANRSGENAPRSLREVEPEISNLADFVVEGESGGGEASAVVDLSGGRIQLLRSTMNLGNEELFRLSGKSKR